MLLRFFTAVKYRDKLRLKLWIMDNEAKPAGTSGIHVPLQAPIWSLQVQIILFTAQVQGLKQITLRQGFHTHTLSFSLIHQHHNFGIKSRTQISSVLLNLCIYMTNTFKSSKKYKKNTETSIIFKNNKDFKWLHSSCQLWLHFTNMRRSACVQNK